MKIIVFTCAGGALIDTYNRYTVPSIADDIDRLRNEGHDVEIGLHDSRDPSLDNPSGFVLGCLRPVMARCIAEGAVMWLAPPDTVFARGTMYNCVKMAEHKPASIAIPHVRVVSPPAKVPISAPALMRHAVDNAHFAFAQSYDIAKQNCTWAGVSARRIGDTVITIQHALPTVYLAQFRNGDEDQMPEWPQWDRGFLGHLWDTDRLIIAGSSDLAACVEITDSGRNVPDIRDMQYNDKFYINSIHNNSLRRLAYTMRLQPLQCNKKRY